MGRKKNVSCDEKNCVVVHYGLLARGVDRSVWDEEDSGRIPKPRQRERVQCVSTNSVYGRIETSF